MHVSSSKNIQLLETKIGYKFKKKSLIKEALTHKSFAKEKSENSEFFNERLEFLGDAVLELVICGYLFSAYPRYTEAEFSKIKSYAVQESTLADIALRLGIGSYLYLGKGEEASGGRKKPSLLANAFEAILAAIYLDSGFKKAKDFTLRNLEGKIKALIRRSLLFDFKTRFQEVVQKKFGLLPKYRVHKEEGPEHMKIFEVKVFVKNDFYGDGRGKSKKEAAQKAAKAGLRKLKEAGQN
jgi:ribonuclease-3